MIIVETRIVIQVYSCSQLGYLHPYFITRIQTERRLNGNMVILTRQSVAFCKITHRNLTAIQKESYRYSNER